MKYRTETHFVLEIEHRRMTFILVFEKNVHIVKQLLELHHLEDARSSLFDLLDELFILYYF
jgi:hypothetical protein